MVDLMKFHFHLSIMTKLIRNRFNYKMMQDYVKKWFNKDSVKDKSFFDPKYLKPTGY